ncbi:MAG TPA: hypothetical protein PK113_03775, partial [Bacillota bacterium]|nr:hypothetical protein [Bacillota bacterium]
MKKIVCVIVIFLSVSLFGCEFTNMTYTMTTKTHFTETSTMSTEVGCQVYSIPDIEISNSVVTTDSFSFDYEIVSEGCQGFISKMYIYEYFEFYTVYTFEDYSETVVSGLESRTDYVLRIEYTFLDIDNDQNKFVKLYSFLTEPELSIDAVNQRSTSDSISFELDIV